MPDFSYAAKLPTGIDTTGVIQAASIDDAIDRLKRQKYLNVQVKPAGAIDIVAILKDMNPFKPSVGSKDLSIFSRQMATLVAAGVPLVQGMGMVASQIQNKLFKAIVEDIKTSIEGGQSISDSMKRHSVVFSDLYVAMIRAGELGGVLDVILDRLSAYLEASEELKAKVKGAMMYPMVMGGIAVAVTLFLMVFIIPKFTEIFESFGAELPTPTQILLNISKFTTHNFYLFIIGPIILYQVWKQVRKTPEGLRRTDAYLLKLPMFGDLLRKVAVAKFCRTMATLVKSGVNILEALETCAKASGNKIIEDTIMESRKSVQEGQRLVEPLKKGGVFPPMVIQMIAIGEETGNLDTMLTKIADFYDTEVDAGVKGLTSMIEPLVICFMGVVIGAIVICMFLPMFQMSSLADNAG